MKKHIAGLVVFLLLNAGLFSCVKTPEFGDDFGIPGCLGCSTDSNHITIWQARFTPDTLRVVRGLIIKWANWDSVPHSIISDNPLFYGFEISAGGEASLATTSTGTFDYRCEKHGERAVLIVEP